MLSLIDRSPTLHNRFLRRDFLQIGGLTSLGLTLPSMLRGEEKTGNRRKACIVLFLFGGPPQHSTWDPKPDAPAEVRGIFKPIQTRVPGIEISELLPRTSEHIEDLALLRAVSTGDNAHSSSGYYMLTGVPHIPPQVENAKPGFPNDWPNIGTVVRSLSQESELPGAVRLPNHIFNTDGSVWPGQDAGFMGRAVDPWLFRCQPASPDFRIPEFTLPVEVTEGRLGDRRSLLQSIDSSFVRAERVVDFSQYDRATQKAFSLLSSEHSRTAFDLTAEPTAVRREYGEGQFGQSVLLARRLIERGVSLVQVNWFRGADEPADNPVWDTHIDENNRLKTVLAPAYDQAHAALLRDLKDRGLLEDTLVISMSEFGRTPRFNARGGRDHWGSVFSIAMAGAGVRGGMVHGASDEIGAQPKNGKVTPEDIAATIFQTLGFDPDTILHDAQGRPFPASRGSAIQAILG